MVLLATPTCKLIALRPPSKRAVWDTLRLSAFKVSTVPATALICGHVTVPFTKERCPSSNVWGKLVPVHIEKSVQVNTPAVDVLRINVNVVS